MLACLSLGVSRATYYRLHRGAAMAYTRLPRAPSSLALSGRERQAILDVFHAPEHLDSSPRTVYAKLLDAGHYLGSVSTLYRVLRDVAEARPRRAERTHPPYAKPELLATGPRELWSWDITKLKGPAKWVHYHLYVILDVFSRYVVGWMLADRESAQLAHDLISATCDKEGIVAGQLTLHADRGTSMRSKPVAPAAFRSRDHQDPLASPGERRQSILRVAVPHREVPPRLPRAVRLRTPCAPVLPDVLPLVQPGALPFRDRVHAARGGALRPGPPTLRRPSTGSGASFQCASTALQGSPPTAACPAHAGRYQPAKHVQSRPRGARRFDTKLPDTDVSKSLTRTASARPKACVLLRHVTVTKLRAFARVHLSRGALPGFEPLHTLQIDSVSDAIWNFRP